MSAEPAAMFHDEHRTSPNEVGDRTAIPPLRRAALAWLADNPDARIARIRSRSYPVALDPDGTPGPSAFVTRSLATLGFVTLNSAGTVTVTDAGRAALASQPRPGPMSRRQMAADRRIAIARSYAALYAELGTLAAVADEVGVSRQRVSEVLARARLRGWCEVAPGEEIRARRRVAHERTAAERERIAAERRQTRDARADAFLADIRARAFATGAVPNTLTLQREDRRRYAALRNLRGPVGPILRALAEEMGLPMEARPKGTAAPGYRAWRAARISASPC